MTPPMKPCSATFLASLLAGAMPALLVATPAAASSPAPAAMVPAPATRPPPPLRDDEFHALLGRALPLAERQDCAPLLGLLDPALPRLAGKNRNIVQMLRIQCLDQLGRGEEVAAAYREMVASDPGDPMVRSVGVVLAASSGDYPEAGRRLASLAEDDPAGLSTITSALVRGVAQQLTQKKDYGLRDRLFLALARADWQPADRPEMRDSLAQGAIEALLERKDVDEATTLLPRVQMPELLVAMATERVYQPLWGAIDARLGPHGASAIDPFVAAQLDNFSRNPDDGRAIRDAVRAFILLGRYPEAVDTAAAVSVTTGMSEEAVTTVRYAAQALAAEGRRADAVARLRPFASVDFARNPALVSGVVSLAEMLDEDNHEEDALAVARDALARGDDAISPWGTSWLRRTEACALAALGRKAEADQVGDTLRAAAADNQAATIEALLCIGRDDEAARLAIETLATVEGTSLLADQFQPEGAFWASSPSRLRALWARLLERRDVRSAFDRTARILPRTYWPAPAPRPIPRLPGDGPTT